MDSRKRVGLFGTVILALISLGVAGSHAADAGAASGRSDRVVRIAGDDAERAEAAAIARRADAIASLGSVSYQNEQVAAVLDDVAEHVHSTHPGTLAGTEVNDHGGVLYLKGAAPASVLEFVDALPVPVAVVDGLSYDMYELEEVSHAVHRELVASGFFLEVASSAPAWFDGLVRTVGTADVPPDESDVLDALTASTSERLLLDVEPASDGFISKDGAFGGMRTYPSAGGGACTSGFTVKQPNGPRGILLAAHCTGQDRIVHPGHATHTMAHVADHEGAYGDMEWKTSPAKKRHKFYTASDIVKDVWYVEARHELSVGERVCGYGRSSNDRVCADVYDVSQACTGEDGVSLFRMVVTEAQGDPMIPGDSGGPWTRNHRAFGVHFGDCLSRETFSLADYADEALGVHVLTVP